MLVFDIAHDGLCLGLVRASGVTSGPSPEPLVAALRAYEEHLREEEAAFDERTRATIRTVLRKGGYKPSGRGKPASEYLFKIACEQGLPLIDVLVDTNNFVSLQSGYPISIFDADKLGARVSVRFGKAGESYVFNSAGQTMELAGIPVICSDDTPVGNAVKDSMACKVGPDTREVLAVVYGSQGEVAYPLAKACQLYAALLERHAGAQKVEVSQLPAA